MNGVKAYAPGEVPLAIGLFLASGLAATGLTVTVDVYREGNTTRVVTGASAVELGNGAYKYAPTQLVLDTSADVLAQYTFVFITAGTADQKRVMDTVMVDARLTAITDTADTVTDIDASQTTSAADLSDIADTIEGLPTYDPQNLIRYRSIGAHVATTLGAGATVITIPDRADGVRIATLTQDVYFTINGTVPTTSLGFKLTAGAEERFIPLSKKDTLTVIRAANGAILQHQFVVLKGVSDLR